MKVRGVKISKYYTGLCNQMTNFIHGIMEAVSHAIDVLVIDDFKMEIHTENTCPIEEIIDLEHLNKFLMREYGLIILGKRQMNIEVEMAEFGTMSRFVDITKELVDTCCTQNRFFIAKHFPLNTLRHDPAEFVRKSIRIRYKVGSYKVSKSYPEEHVSIDIPLQSITEWKEYFESCPVEPHYWFDNLMTRIKFHPDFYEAATEFIDMNINNKKPVSVVHLRMEPDAIRHWSKENHMDEVSFTKELAQKYIDVISNHNYIRTGTVLVLSYTEDGPVFDWFRENNVRYVCAPKHRDKGREWNAILDLVVAEQCCSGVLVGGLDPYRFQGSSFTYFLLKRLNTVYCVLLDIERVREQEIVVYKDSC